jgi:uncharacterized protein DUF5666
MRPIFLGDSPLIGRVLEHLIGAQAPCRNSDRSATAARIENRAEPNTARRNQQSHFRIELRATEMRTKHSAIFYLTAALAVAGCSGGTGGTGVTSSPTPTTAFGTISNFGSVFVNGIEFSTTGANIMLDDNPATQNDLRIGMVITVSGSRSGTLGSATRIDVDGAVRGFVEAKPDANHWTVMGQTILVDDRTNFENSIQPGVGDFAEVHGLITGDGVIAAGFIEKQATPISPIFEVKGFIRNHNNGTKTFQIGALVVDYSNATLNNMPDPTNSWNGLLIEAKGGTCLANPICGTLAASKVEPSGPQVQDAAEMEAEGFVTSFTSASDFFVGSQHVVTTGSTVSECGVASDIAVGVKVEVEGTLVAGTLTASKVVFEDSINLEADIATITLGTNSLTLNGLPGITVTVNSLTDFTGGVSALNNLVVGDHVRIRGRATSGNNVIATQVDKRSADTLIELQGTIQSISGSSTSQVVTILGIAVDTSGFSSSNGFLDVNASTITRSAFFAKAAVGTLVKASGTLGGSTITWNEIELEQ